MKTTLYLILLLSLPLSLIAQTQTINIHSGPYSKFKVFRGSANQAGAGWNTAFYNDAIWLAPVNGSVPDTSISGSPGGCDGPNWSPWHNGDTATWVNVTSHIPDTGCFRKTIRLCGTATSATFAVLADDYCNTYLNGHFLGTQQQAVSGTIYTLNSTQLSWLISGDNVIAIEAWNVNPTCATMSMYGSITMDTVGCIYTATSEIREKYEIQLSPVPAKSNVHLTLPRDFGPCEISLYDLVGNKMLEQISDQSQIILDLAPMAQGIYVLRVKDSQNRIITRRLAKDL